MKRAAFLLGIVLCAAAFLAAAAEMAASAMDPELGWAPAALDVWKTLSPDTFDGLMAWHGEAGWLGLLKLPGWLILGAPGIVLLVAFRHRDPGSISEHEEALYLYDELAKRAHEEGFTNTRDDFDPTAYDDVVPAEDHYARDDVLDDLDPTPDPDPEADRPAHNRDFLLGNTAQKDD